MKKYIFLIIPLLFAGNVLAQEIQISYPVAELGNCQNQEECKVYCNNKKHGEACIAFAEKNNLMAPQEIAVARKMLAGEKGPGGCEDKDSCEIYCNDMSHMNECISYAEANSLIPPEELADAKKVQAAMARGINPPACKDKKACDSYCESADHMEECMNFAIQAGFMDPKESEDAKKMLQALKRGVKPLPCKGKEACDQFCNKPENMETCITFAVEAGLMPEEEKANAEKMLQAMKQGINPPPCKGKEECDIYCNQEGHLEECIKFTEAMGLISPEDAQKVRQNGAVGPGGCTGKACETFCNDPANKEVCFQFAKDHGQIAPEELQKMQEGDRMLKETLQQAPPEVIDCLNKLLGAEKVEGLKNGTIQSREVGDQTKQCFDQWQAQKEAAGKTNNIAPNASGPGGCQSEAECEAYCSTHREECGASAPMPPDANPPLPGLPSEPQTLPENSPQSLLFKFLMGGLIYSLK